MRVLLGTRGAALGLLACLLAGCGASDDDSMSATCMPGTTTVCTCPNNQASTMTCSVTGASFQPCACNVTGTGGSAASGSGGTGIAGSGSGGVPGTGGTMVQAGSGGISGAGGAPAMSGAGGMFGGSGGMTGGSGGMTGGSGGITGGSGGSGGNSSDEFDSVRQFCVDHINMYRATMSLPALARETHDKEMCSDMGAKQDSDTNSPHGSAGMCFMAAPYYGAGQNTCPSLPVGGFGAATLQDALKGCIDSMWGEGPPPMGTSVQQCIDDHAGCFQMHGHWINMIQTMYKTVSCGFYKKADGSYWANQDFPIKL